MFSCFQCFVFSIKQTIHSVDFLAYFCSFIIIQMHWTRLDIRYVVKTVQKLVAVRGVGEQARGLGTFHHGVARHSVLVIARADEVVEKHAHGAPLPPRYAQVTLVVVRTVVRVLEYLIH